MANGTPPAYPAPSYPNVWATVKGYATNLWWVIALVLAVIVLLWIF